VLNFILPEEKKVLSMHCSANVGKNKDISLFFGLSGTGKTTLSTDPNRTLIGDDEIGWATDSIFNFEGGCYAKVINLDPVKEPEIYHAIKPGAIVENVVFKKNTNEIDFNDITITQNTRVSYPLHFIENSTDKPIYGNPTNIFFLTCDSYGILPPISLLTKEQAMYQFISGYTAKIAGTEEGIKTPKETFSICFGAPFMPLNPNKYALLLGEKIEHHKAQVWLINTGWSGGSFGVGKRMNLNFTRAMIEEALNGNLLKVPFENMPIFNLKIPTICNNVPSNILNPRNTWQDVNLYDTEALKLAHKFTLNFKKFEDLVDEKIKNAGPKIN
ncbi:MAG: phosphoenolpyruvate carboxykinase (ATP), partial [Sediminibacterium sp.]|nr:phosphoenolpyruvate carboxykinase (ATP) [Sediminibacterium sp.]